MNNLRYILESELEVKPEEKEELEVISVAESSTSTPSHLHRVKGLQYHCAE